jgi:hypothetical protein
MLRLPHLNRWHVIPRDDLRDHEDSADCWCKPQEDDETPGLFIHNSLDGREKYETGELLEH